MSVVQVVFETDPAMVLTPMPETDDVVYAYGPPRFAVGTRTKHFTRISTEKVLIDPA